MYHAPKRDEVLETTIVTAITTTVFAAVNGRKTYNQIEFDDQAGQWAQALMKADENSVYYKEGVKLAGLPEDGGHATVEYITGMYERMGIALPQAEATVAAPQRIDIRDNTQFNLIPYEDTASQETIMQKIHANMVEEGRVVSIVDKNGVAEHYPDLRSIKKVERNAILKERITALKAKLRGFLAELKCKEYNFSVNGNILEAKIYDRGIREVTEKLTQDKAKMLYQTDAIFRNAQYLYSTPDYDGNPAVYRWDYFYTPVRFGESILGVRIAVRDVATAEQSQIYHWGLKTAPSLDGGAGRQAVSQTNASSDGAKKSISQSEQDVKAAPAAGSGKNSEQGAYAYGVERNEYSAQVDSKVVDAVDALAKLFVLQFDKKQTLQKAAFYSAIGASKCA